MEGTILCHCPTQGFLKADISLFFEESGGEAPTEDFIKEAKRKR
jgi:hypothetical protein